MKGANVLVTGATGFLGGRLARKLRDSGFEVIAIGRNADAGVKLVTDGIRFEQVDLSDPDRTKKICKGIDTVFHCAAFSSLWGAYRDFYTHNVEATRHLLNACIHHHIRRMVNVSTPSVYCTNKDRFNIREQEPLPPRYVNAYATTKRLAEIAVEEAQAAHPELETITLRPRGIFGPGDTTILPRLIKANSLSGVPLFRGGSALMDLTYIDNVVDALLLAGLAQSEVTGRAYNISNGEPVRLLDTLNQLFQLLDIPMRPRRLPLPVGKAAATLMEGIALLTPGRPEPLMTRYAVSLLGISQTLDITDARELLGYKPRINMNESLVIFADWWRNTQ